MFSWSNLFNLQNCDLNDSMVSWLGVEKESLSTESVYKLQETKSDRNSTPQENYRQDSDLNYRTTQQQIGL